MNHTLQTRNALHKFNVRHSGHMPEMDAIRRSDTVREAKHAGMSLYDDDAPTGAAVVWGLGAFVATLVLLLLVFR